jgi:hypothetical protein
MLARHEVTAMIRKIRFDDDDDGNNHKSSYFRLSYLFIHL